MTGSRRTTILAGLATSSLALAGCASDAHGPVATAPSSPVSPAPAPDPVPSSATPCPSAGSALVPDGAWTGPVTARVRASGAGTRARGTGSGQLQVILEGGRVAGGTWTLGWESAGSSSAHESASTLSIQGQVAGTVTGGATRPVVEGRWVVAGLAVVTSPVTATAPIDARGRDRAALAVRTRACDAVTGAFTVVLRSADPLVASRVRARWVGRPSQ